MENAGVVATNRMWIRIVAIVATALVLLGVVIAVGTAYSHQLNTKSQNLCIEHGGTWIAKTCVYPNP